MNEDSSAARLLTHVTLRGWLAAESDERSVITDALHEVVPSSFVLASIVGHAGGPLPFYLHQPSSLGFWLFFGDRFVMGLDDEAAAAFRRAQLADEGEYGFVDRGALETFTRRQQPARVVDVAPFFLAESELDTQWRGRFGLEGLRDALEFNATLRRVLAEHGWRLPSEAELEFAHLDGWCEDDWHETFVGAPGDASAWGHGAAVARVAGVRRPFDGSTRAAGRPAVNLLPPALGNSAMAKAARAQSPPASGSWRSWLR